MPSGACCRTKPLGGTKRLDKILAEDAQILKNYWAVTTEGNWEHKNILYAKKSIIEFAKLNNIEVSELHKKIQLAKSKLLVERSKT